MIRVSALVSPRSIDRYALYDEIASGGMAVVHLGRLRGSIGFARTVAIKRLHPHFAKDNDFRSMFIDEARLAARITHPNVVQTLDVVAEGDEVFLVMEYVAGETLSRLLVAAETNRVRVPPAVAVAIVCGALYGLHAAHEAAHANGEPLSLVHRDVSPQNIIVGVDGVARVLDFGIAKATGRIHATREGLVRGKLAYMPPEQLAGVVTRKCDVYAAAVVLWEALTQRRLFAADDERELYSKVLDAPIPPPSQVAPDLGMDFDDVVMRGINRDPERRFPTARDMAVALEARVPVATTSQVGTWVRAIAEHSLAGRATLVRTIEEGTTDPPAEALPLPKSRPTLREDPSTGSLATSTRVRRGKPLRLRMALVALGMFALGATTVAIVSKRASGPTSTPASVAPATIPPTMDDTPGPSQSASVGAAPSASSAAAVQSPRRRPAASRQTPPQPTPSLVVVPPPSPSPPRSGPSCDPPFRIGARGEKIWLPECFPQ
jgi:serine/threonine protein kinase